MSSRPSLPARSLLRSAVTISLVPETRGGPFVFSSGLADGCAQARELGFDAVEVFPPSADLPELAELPGLLQRHSLQVAAVGTGAGWVLRKLTLTHADPAVRAQARDFILAIIDYAARLGAPAIIGSMQGRAEGAVSRAQALEWLGAALDELGDHAGRQGVNLLYEPLNRYETNLFNRLEDTAVWLASRRSRHVKILADFFHLAIEEGDLGGALRVAGPLVGHIHFADSNRRAIGFGHTDVAPLVAALREIGFDGYLSAEILPLPSPLAAARQTIAAFRRFAG
jgi:sugar phosphate isomerase/epimerase